MLYRQACIARRSGLQNLQESRHLEYVRTQWCCNKQPPIHAANTTPCMPHHEGATLGMSAAQGQGTLRYLYGPWHLERAPGMPHVVSLSQALHLWHLWQPPADAACTSRPQAQLPDPDSARPMLPEGQCHAAKAADPGAPLLPSAAQEHSRSLPSRTSQIGVRTDRRVLSPCIPSIPPAAAQCYTPCVLICCVQSKRHLFIQGPSYASGFILHGVDTSASAEAISCAVVQRMRRMFMLPGSLITRWNDPTQVPDGSIPWQ